MYRSTNWFSMLLASFRREPWSTITTADACRIDSGTAEPLAVWTAADAQGRAPKGDDLQWYELKGFSGIVVLTEQQSHTPGLVAHSAPSPDVSGLSKGPEVKCWKSLVGQCNGARLGEHFEGTTCYFYVNEPMNASSDQDVAESIMGELLPW